MKASRVMVLPKPPNQRQWMTSTIPVQREGADHVIPNLDRGGRATQQPLVHWRRLVALRGKKDFFGENA